MTIRFTRWLLIDDEQLFHVEQWAALAIGIGCLGASVWSALHNDPTPFAAVSHRRQEVFAAVRWPLIVAVGLIGTALVRFAFFEGGNAVTRQVSTSQKPCPPEEAPQNHSAHSKLLHNTAGRA